MKDVSKRLRELRQEKGMTQDELAERLHVTRQAVSSWETKKTRPDVEMLEKICAVLGVDLMEFLYGKEKRPIEKRKLIPVVVFGAMTALAVLLRIFALPIVMALANRTYHMRGVVALGVVLRVLCGALIPLVLSVISLYLDVAVKHTAVRRVLLLLGLVPIILALIMAAMAIVWNGQSSASVWNGWFAVYMALYAVTLSQYTPVVAGGLLYLGIKKPNKKGEDL